MPYVRGGDLVIAHLGWELASTSWLAFGDRVHADRPLVGFVLAVDDPARLELMIAEGLPSSATAIGYGTSDGWSADQLAASSAAIRNAGRRMFVTTTTTPGAVGYNEIGQRADLIELDARSSDPTALELEVEPVVRALRSTGTPFIYVQPPPSLTTTAEDVSAVTGAILSRTAGVGISLPASAPISVLVELRASP
jgi:hypothetical protein